MLPTYEPPGSAILCFRCGESRIYFFCPKQPIRGVGRISQETRPAPLSLVDIARPGPSAHVARPGTLCAGLRSKGPQRATERAPRPLALTGRTSPHPTLRGARAPRLLRGRACGPSPPHRWRAGRACGPSSIQTAAPGGPPGAPGALLGARLP